MTIGLAVISRSRTDISLTTEIEESARAFSAAEAGIEQALQTGSGTNGVQTLSSGKASFTTIVNQIAAASGIYRIPELVRQGDTQNIWLVNHNPDGTINETPVYTANTIQLCWRGNTATVPALIVGVMYKRTNNYYMVRTGYDADQSRDNRFLNPGGLGNGCGQNNVYSVNVDFVNTLALAPAGADTLLALRLRPVYSDIELFINSPVINLPSQGNIIESIGTTPTGLTRRIVVERQFRAAPGIFDAAVVSQSDFVK